MTIAAPPIVMRVAVRCTGWRQTKDGPKLCDALLAKLDYTAFDGVIALVCPKCGKKVEFR